VNGLQSVVACCLSGGFTLPGVRARPRSAPGGGGRGTSSARRETRTKAKMATQRFSLRRILPGMAAELRRYREECRAYHRVHGRTPDLRRPTHFSEKVILRKLYDRNYLYAKCSDKIAVRDYVAKRAGREVLVPLVFHTARPEELLAMECWADRVIKPNHGSMMVEILPAEEPPHEAKLRVVETCRRWLATDYSTFYNELHYARIERRILVEAFVGERGRRPLECKVHCFPQRDGSLRTMVQLISDRFGDKAMAFYLGGIGPSDLVRSIGERPPRIGEGPQRAMVADALDRSAALSEDFDYVRVDWMLTPGRLYFSELTFTPGAGLSSSFGPELERRLCELWAR
jgi:hypothetical protein